MEDHDSGSEHRKRRREADHDSESERESESESNGECEYERLKRKRDEERRRERESDLARYAQGTPEGSSLSMFQMAERHLSLSKARLECDAEYDDEFDVRFLSGNTSRYRGLTLRALWYWTPEEWAMYDRRCPENSICCDCGLSDAPVLSEHEARGLGVDDPMWWTWSECKVGAALALKKPDWDEEDVSEGDAPITDLEAYLVYGIYRFVHQGQEVSRRHCSGCLHGECTDGDKPALMGQYKHSDEYCHDEFTFGEDDWPYDWADNADAAADLSE